MSWAALVLGAYLLGSVSFSVLAVRALRGVDIRSVGSGNAGATNVLRAAGMGPAAAVLLLDVAKGVAAVLAAYRLDAPGPVIGATAVAVALGHVLPLYYGFRGGKGVATVAGALGALAPLPMTLAVVFFALLVAVSRVVALASIVTAAVFPLLVWLCGRAGFTAPAPAWLLVTAAALCLLVIVKHGANIGRLRAGTEPRLGAARRKEA